MVAAEASERRRYKRFAVRVPAQLQMIFPEETLTPVVMTGKIRDLSAYGARVYVYDLTQDLYDRIMAGHRSCRMMVRFGEDPVDTRLFGRINNFVLTGKVADGESLLGIDFQENENDDIERLRSYLEVTTGEVVE